MDLGVSNFQYYLYVQSEPLEWLSFVEDMEIPLTSPHPNPQSQKYQRRGKKRWYLKECTPLIPSICKSRSSPNALCLLSRHSSAVKHFDSMFYFVPYCSWISWVTEFLMISWTIRVFHPHCDYRILCNSTIWKPSSIVNPLELNAHRRQNKPSRAYSRREIQIHSISDNHPFDIWL